MTESAQTFAGSDSQLGQVLIERNYVQPQDVDKAMQIQESVGGRLGNLLVRIGALSEDLLLTTMAEQLGIVYLRNSEELPDSLRVFQFMVASPIKLSWFLDHAVLLWDEGEQVCCLARDVLDGLLRAHAVA